MRIGILTEFPSVCLQSGPAIHTRVLCEGLRRRGHHVVLIGPDTSGRAPVDGSAHLFAGAPYPTADEIRVPMPWPPDRLLSGPRLDVIHGMTNSPLIHYGLWWRKLTGCAFVNTHIIHVPSYGHVLLSDRLYDNRLCHFAFQRVAYSVERGFAGLYEEADGLIVQSRHLLDYWRERGVLVPMTAVGRFVDPATFDRLPGRDPYPLRFPAGRRLLSVCRQDREKNLDRLLRIFVEQLAPADPRVTLTLVGDGVDHHKLRRRAAESAYAHRIHLPGEIRHEALVDWYGYADLFVYTSLSETFGNVVNEALWSGLPVVAFDDGMGVAGQVSTEVNGLLVRPDEPHGDARFGQAVRHLLRHDALRWQLGEGAALEARRRSHPDRIIGQYEAFYATAIEHRKRNGGRPLRERGFWRRAGAFTHHMAHWAQMSLSLLAVAHVTTGLGPGRAGRCGPPEAVTAAAADALRADSERPTSAVLH